MNDEQLDELIKLRAFRDQVDASTQRIEAGIDRAAAGSEQVSARIKHLEDLIETYATTTMPFEQFLTLALGDERAARILERSDAQTQAALLDQWHDLM